MDTYLIDPDLDDLLGPAPLRSDDVLGTIDSALDLARYQVVKRVRAIGGVT